MASSNKNKWCTPTGYCKYCRKWSGYTPKSDCKEYGIERKMFMEMHLYYNNKEHKEVSPGIWKPVNEISNLGSAISFIEDYLQVDREKIVNIEFHALEVIKMMDGIKYTL